MSYEDSIQYLYSLRRFGIKLGLSNIEKLLSILGSPQNYLKSIHVAGTNGKGTTAAFIASILEAAGYRVGLYTSPHLLDFTERIRVRGQRISEGEVIELTREIRDIVESRKEPNFASLKTITFFEFTTAMALDYFCRRGVDFAVLEVGMGGRFDATNVVRPLISVITQIDYDHTAYLGTTLEEIAGEKAGIIKEGVPVFSNCDNKRALGVIKRTCNVKGAKLFLAGRDFRCSGINCDVHGSVFDLTTSDAKYSRIAIRLLGKHQVSNAALAAAACLKLGDFGFSISETALRRGLFNSWLRGRLELLPGSPTILLDGAHNCNAIEALRDSLRLIFKGKKVVFVLGMMKDKDIASIIEVLSKCADLFIVTKPAMNRSADPALIKKELLKKGKRALVFRRVMRAVEAAKSIAGPDDLICVTGSFYTVSETIEYLERIDLKKGGIKIVV